ncbi:MAG: 50S ribosomal protein L32 [Lentisphaeria bacterium]|nr:50S ribosomal protein L32 [Lentisphaeria bacterium]
MAQPKRKTSKSKTRIRQAANAYKGLQINKCGTCGAPALSHQVCNACGTYKGKQIITVKS